MVTTWLFDFLNFLYPEVCSACSNSLFKGEKVFCTRCLLKLPKTGFHNQVGNPVEKQFWGKVSVNAATALYYFNKGERVQHLIHRLKYKGDKDAGVFAGRILAGQLRKCDRFESIDAIVPVPLHLKKLRIRGYNQSECFAAGIGEELSVPVYPKYLIRRKATDTQTRKSRFARFENVNNQFQKNPEHKDTIKHILLVDDVITTGSTLSSCVEAICHSGPAKVSIAAIAYARM